ncbi:MAG: helix-turn-helix transcriptional regulator [Rhodospirillaceae bacterium]|jgi:AraC-like DNA-binding protein/quercetin dioxygenase-like cupin family protein|nr:helix-turn-helix transcriptional regulator [Rhodospirillaceae bacterium]MBT5245482.1 helix-turn-helix transcriptional regulator [Rhodospirillaceae bacterium]MBT5560964.1 helix-turn-helix transcriptional regulator [Rhodospirillaceae bacterium]MBT6240600.1 helix-turn-helix transcriptional regulator [Rhodospirillaceae bacterium]MBT7137935.1 helix-turn-helix transcriptional regulator [Rhodospirillaceae bacterium]
MPAVFGFQSSPTGRRNPIDDRETDAVPRPIAFRKSEILNGHSIERHHHARAQLLYGSKGVLIVETSVGIWIVPPLRAVWIPPLIDHEVSAQGMVTVRSLYFHSSIIRSLPTDCCVVTVSPLLREMILRAVEMPTLYDENGADGRFMAVLLDQIKALPETPLHLPGTDHPHLLPIYRSLSENPADVRPLESWAEELGTSTRTLTRLFQKETGMSFRQWRQQVRLLEALTRLAAGMPVTNVAMDLGYESQSAFIAMFKKALGKTPGKYFDV